MVRDRGLHEKCAILAGVIPLKSAGMAKHMKKNVPGMDVPDSLIERLKRRAEGKAGGRRNQDLRGNDPADEGNQGRARRAHHGDRMGTEGGRDRQGRRLVAQAPAVKINHNLNHEIHEIHEMIYFVYFVFFVVIFLWLEFLSSTTTGT